MSQKGLGSERRANNILQKTEVIDENDVWNTHRIRILYFLYSRKREYIIDLFKCF